MKTYEESIMTKEEALMSLEEVFIVYTECLSKTGTASVCNENTIKSRNLELALDKKDPSGIISILEYNSLYQKYSELNAFPMYFKSRIERGFETLLKAKKSEIIKSIKLEIALTDSKKLISESLWEDDREKEVFLSSFLAHCYTREFNYGENEKLFFIDLLVYCIESLDVLNSKPFVSSDFKKTINNFLKRYSGDINRLSNYNEKVLEGFLKNIDERSALLILSNKDHYFEKWKLEKPNQEEDNIRVFCDYCVANKGSLDSDSAQSLYDILKYWNSRSYYPSKILLESKYTLLGLLKPQDLMSMAKNSMKGIKIEERSAIFISIIKSGFLTPKIARKMRSEGSSEISNRCLMTIFDKRDSYQNSVELVSQFLDSKYTDVIFTLFKRGGVDDLMGLIGNPSVNQDKLFEKINLLKGIPVET